jgi:hypothetical protein
LQEQKIGGSCGGAAGRLQTPKAEKVQRSCSEKLSRHDHCYATQQNRQTRDGCRCHKNTPEKSQGCGLPHGIFFAG